MQLTKSQQTMIDNISTRNHLAFMIAFGSRISGKTHAESDIDIGIIPKDPVSSYNLLLNVQSELKSVFPGEPIDVRYLTNTTPLFFFEAVYKGKLLFGDRYAYAKLCAKAFKEYADTQKLRDLQCAMIQDKQRIFMKATL